MPSFAVGAFRNTKVPWPNLYPPQIPRLAVNGLPATVDLRTRLNTTVGNADGLCVAALRSEAQKVPVDPVQQLFV